MKWWRAAAWPVIATRQSSIHVSEIMINGMVERGELKALSMPDCYLKIEPFSNGQ